VVNLLIYLIKGLLGILGLLLILILIFSPFLIPVLIIVGLGFLAKKIGLIKIK